MSHLPLRAAHVAPQRAKGAGDAHDVVAEAQMLLQVEEMKASFRSHERNEECDRKRVPRICALIWARRCAYFWPMLFRLVAEGG